QHLSQEEASVMEAYKAALSENTGKDGGYIVPEDITTTINQLKQTVDSLEQYVNVQPVSTNKGARTLEKRAASTPFAPLSEYGKPNVIQFIFRVFRFLNFRLCILIFTTIITFFCLCF
ncbi:phage major capsid protein, partial [Escherichia sp. TWPC-MK]